MNVPSYAFLAFSAVIAVLINISPVRAWRQSVWLVANLAFVTTFTRASGTLIPFIALLGFGFLSVKVLERTKSRALFWALLILLIAAFCWLKRYAFIPDGAFLPFAYFTVGMSYVFFRITHIVIDAYQDALPERVGALNYANYTLNFPSLVSGPIQLYPDYLRSQDPNAVPLRAPLIARAVERIIMGLFKVTIVSPLLLALHQRVLGDFAQPFSVAERAVLAALMLAVYPVYVYVNFSGYMDFVIGIARFLRLDLPENFNRPFVSRGFIEFWGRWHITLATWIKTYVYTPLFMGLMRQLPSPRAEPVIGVLAYFVAFFVVGVWHGQTSMFVSLGVLLGLGVSVNKLYQIVMIRCVGRSRYGTLCDGALYTAFSRALTFSWFAFASLWFWATWQQLGAFVLTLGVRGVPLTLIILFLVAAAIFGLWNALPKSLSPREERNAPRRTLFSSPYMRTAWYTALATFAVSVAIILNAPAPHVIYKAF